MGIKVKGHNSRFIYKAYIVFLIAGFVNVQTKRFEGAWCYVYGQEQYWIRYVPKTKPTTKKNS